MTEQETERYNQLADEARAAAVDDDLPTPEAVIEASDKQLFRLLRKGDSEERAGLLRLLARVGKRGKRVAERVLASDGYADETVLGLLRFLADRQPEHPLVAAFDGLSEAIDKGDVDAASERFDQLTKPLTHAWMRHQGRSALLSGKPHAARLLEQHGGVATLLLDGIDRETQSDVLDELASLYRQTDARSLKRAIRSTFFRLAQQGVEIPQLEEVSEVASVAPAELESFAFLSAVDPTGDTAIWILEELREGGYSLLQAIIDGDGSLSSTRAMVVVRRGRDQLIQNLNEERGVPVEQVPVEAAMGILEDAYAQNPTAVGKDYRSWRHQSRVDRRARRPQYITVTPEQSTALIQRSRELLDTDACAHWLLTRRDAEQARELLGQTESSLVLPDHEQTRRRSEGLSDIAAKIWPSAERLRVARRLDMLSLFFAHRADETNASIARATGVQIRSSADSNPLLEGLIERSLDALERLLEQEKEKPESGPAAG